MIKHYVSDIKTEVYDNKIENKNTSNKYNSPKISSQIKILPTTGLFHLTFYHI